MDNAMKIGFLYDLHFKSSLDFNLLIHVLDFLSIFLY